MLSIFVKLLFIEYGLSKKISTVYEKVMRGYISTNSAVEFITNFGSITKGAKPLNSGYLLVAPRFNR